jgi:hypothetical protein
MDGGVKPEKRYEMKGIVRFVNLRNALVAVETKGGFTVFEICERCALDIGDEIAGPLDSRGRETLYNATKDEDFRVAIENVGCNRVDAMKLLD